MVPSDTDIGTVAVTSSEATTSDSLCDIADAGCSPALDRRSSLRVVPSGPLEWNPEMPTSALPEYLQGIFLERAEFFYEDFQKTRQSYEFKEYPQDDARYGQKKRVCKTTTPQWYSTLMWSRPRKGSNRGGRSRPRSNVNRPQMNSGFERVIAGTDKEPFTNKFTRVYTHRTGRVEEKKITQVMHWYPMQVRELVHGSLLYGHIDQCYAGKDEKGNRLWSGIRTWVSPDKLYCKAFGVDYKQAMADFEQEQEPSTSAYISTTRPFVPVVWED